MDKHVGKLHPLVKKQKGRLQKSSGWEALRIVDTQWAYRPTSDKKHLYRVKNCTVVPLTPSPTPNIGVLPSIIPPSGLATPAFYRTLYWTKWIEEIKGSETWTSSLMKAVFGLVELPNEANINAIGDHERKTLETGLLRVHKFLSAYLLSADAWLNLYHHSLRERLKGRLEHISLYLLGLELIKYFTVQGLPSNVWLQVPLHTTGTH
jgi:hypothetical protein